jgi:hypothetical protein
LSGNLTDFGIDLIEHPGKVGDYALNENPPEPFRYAVEKAKHCLWFLLPTTAAALMAAAVIYTDFIVNGIKLCKMSLTFVSENLAEKP